VSRTIARIEVVAALVEGELCSPGRFPIFSQKPGGRIPLKVAKKRRSRKNMDVFFERSPGGTKLAFNQRSRRRT
jgi:hypothetical protein